MDALGLKPRLVRQAPKDEEGAGPRERTTLGVEEQLGPVALVEMRSAPRHVEDERIHTLPAEGHDPFLVTLSEATNDAVLEVDAAPVKRDGLGYPKPGSVEQLHQRAITEIARFGPVRGFDQALDLLWRQDARELPTSPGGLYLARWIVGAFADQDQMLVERTRRR